MQSFKLDQRNYPTLKIGNAGSFFKNPTITKDFFEILIAKFPKMIAYPITDNTYKIAAGWLIEACGWKGIQKGNVGCYEKQSWSLSIIIMDQALKYIISPRKLFNRYLQNLKSY